MVRVGIVEQQGSHFSSVPCALTPISALKWNNGLSRCKCTAVIRYRFKVGYTNTRYQQVPININSVYWETRIGMVYHDLLPPPSLLSRHRGHYC